MKIKAIIGSEKLEEKLINDLNGEKGSPPELLVISRKWEKGGAENLVEEVKTAVYDGCSYVVTVLGRKDREAEKIEEELWDLGVPGEAILYGNPVKYSQLLEHVKKILAQKNYYRPGGVAGQRGGKTRRNCFCGRSKKN